MTRQKVRKPVPKGLRAAWFVVCGMSFFLFLYRVFFGNGDWFQAFSTALQFTVIAIIVIKAFDDNRKARKP